ncbi:glucose-6-phosphatase-like [Trichoplusia ni]|uniref:glucose-6-phosphatase n=1 Tax=Trichoplusia ni TaxID=7111 RepID=A0A7E5WPD0_TRINI|nr:glucose-6-phosphatase-like [Trichoplusia ni]
MSVMDRVNAFGVSIISVLQARGFNENIIYAINEASNPQHLLMFYFPFVAVIDSVFAAQLLLCMAFSGWLTSMIKWLSLSDRPYWWVQETSYYLHDQRPILKQTSQTCEIGSGNPSEHMTSAVIISILFCMWMTSYLDECQCKINWSSWIMFPFCFYNALIVMIAQLYTAVHFPHQCLIGAMIGAILVPVLCVYIIDPYIWQYGAVSNKDTVVVRVWYVLSTIGMTLIAVFTYYCYKSIGWQPSWSIKLAYRYCDNPANITRTSIPLFSIMTSTAYMLGWALFVSPAVIRYRYFTKPRSIPLGLLIALLFLKIFQLIEHFSCNLDIKTYYLVQFLVTVCKPGLFLRVLPSILKLPYFCITCCEQLALKMEQ